MESTSSRPWAVTRCDGTLLRIPASGDPAVTLGEGTVAVVDDTCVYFSNLDGIFSVVKSYVPPPSGPGPGPSNEAGSGASGCASSSSIDSGSEEAGPACDAACDGTCVGGRCLITLASGSSNANGMAIDSANVYWTEFPAGNVKKVPLGGGSVTTLASGQSGPLGIVVDSTSVYWTGQSETGSFPNYTQTGTVAKAPLDGGPPVTLASGQSNPNSIAVDSTSVYWTNGRLAVAVHHEGGARRRFDDYTRVGTKPPQRHRDRFDERLLDRGHGRLRHEGPARRRPSVDACIGAEQLVQPLGEHRSGRY